MTIDTSQIGKRAWSFAHVLRDDGLSYQAYIEQITFRLFLKMADELTKPPHNREPLVPASYGIRRTGYGFLLTGAAVLTGSRARCQGRQGDLVLDRAAAPSA